MQEKPISASAQDYLKTIYELTGGGEPVATLQIAERLSVAPPSVTNMLQRLAAHQPPLVEYQKHQGAHLTDAGREAALRTIRRHRLLELFLVQMMGYRWDEVHSEAERMEHVISPLFEDRLASILGEPNFDPHGDPIPGRDLNLPATDLLSIDRLRPGQSGIVRRVRSSDAGLLRYLHELRLDPGTQVELLALIPYDRTLRILVSPGGKEQALGLDLAELIEVEPLS